MFIRDQLPEVSYIGELRSDFIDSANWGGSYQDICCFLLGA